jgi:hypothetical protein
MVIRPTETCFESLALSFQNRISGFPYDAPRRSLDECIGDLSPTGRITRALVVESPFYGHVIFVDL